MAKERGAFLCALEHRFYGESHPFNDTSTENLKYLTSRQALADLASFIEFIKDQNKDKDLYKVIIVGGSYSGCLSAWFRQMYPHLVLGSIASSGPVLAKEDYYEYDQAIGDALSSECKKNVQDAMKEIEEAVDADVDGVMKAMTCKNTTDGTDLLAGMADMVSHAIQYNMDSGSEEKQTKKLLCDLVSKEDKSKNKGKKEELYQFFTEMLSRMKMDCDTFVSLNDIYNTTKDAEKATRQWMYQSCTEFGYFQIAPANDSVRSSRINLDYYKNICKKAFGEETVLDTKTTNEFYHERNAYTTNVVFSNGMMDPWSRLGIMEKYIPGLGREGDEEEERG